MNTQNLTPTYLLGKYMMIVHPLMLEKEDEENYYSRKMQFLRENGLLNRKSFEFLSIKPHQVQKSIYESHNVVLQVTEKCNLNCVYCTYGTLYGDQEKRSERNANLSNEDAFRLLEYMALHWRERKAKGIEQKISIGFYGGEPLLNFPLIQEAVQWTKSKQNKALSFNFYMTSNGLLLDKHLDFLIQNNFSIDVSLDGDKEQMIYRIDHNGKNRFDKIYKILKTIQREYPDFFLNNIKFLTVLHHKNPIDKVYNFFLKEFDKTPLFSELLDVNINSEKQELFDELNNIIKTPIPQEIMKRIMGRETSGIKSILNFVHSFSGYYFINYYDLLKGKTDNIRLNPTGTCFPFSLKIYMDARGKIYPCERIDSCFDMGNIRDEVIFDMEKIAAKYNQLYEQVSPHCSICHTKYACPKCLFHISNILETPQCDKMMNAEAFSRHLNKMIWQLKSRPNLYRKIMKQIMPAI